MGSDLLAAARSLREAVGSFDAAIHSGAECRVIAEELAGAAKAANAAAGMAAARAASCGAHRDAGFRDAADWLARTQGATVSSAKDALAVAESLESCPATREALMAGTLSMTQAAEITKTEAVVSGCEAELVALAQKSSLVALRDTARSQRLRAADVDELYARQRAKRYLRHWRDEDGMVCLSGALPPVVGVAIANRLDAETERLRREAKQSAGAGNAVESRDAYGADALVNLVEGTAKVGKGRTELSLVADINAWLRGEAQPGEPVHIIGGGPIPVAVAKELSKNAFLKVVLHDGVAIHTVAHYGRHVPAEIQSALELGSRPDFEGAVCVEQGCGRRYGLERDHVDPVANGGPTSYDNLEFRCYGDHQDKTERDRAAGLLTPRAPNPAAPDPADPAEATDEGPSLESQLELAPP